MIVFPETNIQSNKINLEKIMDAFKSDGISAEDGIKYLINGLLERGDEFGSIDIPPDEIMAIRLNSKEILNSSSLNYNSTNK